MLEQDLILHSNPPAPKRDKLSLKIISVGCFPSLKSLEWAKPAKKFSNGLGIVKNIERVLFKAKKTSFVFKMARLDFIFHLLAKQSGK